MPSSPVASVSSRGVLADRVFKFPGGPPNVIVVVRVPGPSTNPING
jgi:hypothetical protein